jgi:hypothetical protein
VVAIKDVFGLRLRLRLRLGLRGALAHAHPSTDAKKRPATQVSATPNGMARHDSKAKPMNNRNRARLLMPLILHHCAQQDAGRS